MNNKLICPFCEQELDYLGEDIYGCRKHNYLFGTKELWQELIRTKKQLEMANAELDYIKEQIEKNSVFDNTRKALDVAKDTIRHADWFFDGDYNVDAKTMHNEIKYAIKAITALEQKE